MTASTIFLIGGPTASGKSALALEVARRQPSTIINADAMQVYAGLPILTAQPEDKGDVPHELFEIADTSERFSVGKWLALAEDAIQRSLATGRTPILVGGTGLYFKALLEGLADIPPIPEAVRAEVQALYEQLGSEPFRAALAKLDPASATRIKPNDKQRLVRAYEVVTHTGKTLGEWQEMARGGRRDSLPREGGGDGSVTFRPLLLQPPRDELYAACDRRFLQMIEHGALREVRALLARNLDPDLPAMKILGVRELAAHLRGEIPLQEAIAAAQQATRNYAKRQMTWFRGQWKGTEVMVNVRDFS